MLPDNEINTQVREALENLNEKDNWLIDNNLSEQSISHRIALYLTSLFPDYDVDCEYNGDVDRRRNRKMITILKDELKAAELFTEKKSTTLEQEIALRAVFPDIIIHKRGTNEQNLCIIEVKKNSSRIPYDYDFIKLSAYTSGEYGNTLKYQLGIFIEIIVKSVESKYKLTYFKDGREIELDETT